MYILDATQGIVEHREEQSASYGAVAWNSLGTKVACVGSLPDNDSNYLFVLDADSGSVLVEYVYEDDETVAGCLYALAWSPCGVKLATAGWEGELQPEDSIPPSSHSLDIVDTDHPDWFSGFGRLADYDDYQSFNLASSGLFNKSRVRGLAYNSTGTKLAFCSPRQVVIADVAQSVITHKVAIGESMHRLSVAWNPSGTKFAFGGIPGNVLRIADAQSGAVEHKVELHSKAEVKATNWRGVAYIRHVEWTASI